MEKRLEQMFGFQWFAVNADLQRVIHSVHARYANRELNLEDMSLVAAAGSPEKNNQCKKPEIE